MLLFFVFILFSGCASDNRSVQLNETEMRETTKKVSEVPDSDTFWNRGFFLEYMNKDEILSYEMKYDLSPEKRIFVCRLMDPKMDTIWEAEASDDKDYIDSIIQCVYECEKSARKIKENEEINDITFPDELLQEEAAHDWTEDEHIILADSYYFYIIGKHEGKYYFDKHLVATNETIRKNYLVEQPPVFAKSVKKRWCKRKKGGFRHLNRNGKT